MVKWRERKRGREMEGVGSSGKIPITPSTSEVEANFPLAPPPAPTVSSSLVEHIITQESSQSNLNEINKLFEEIRTLDQQINEGHEELKPVILEKLNELEKKYRALEENHVVSQVVEALLLKRGDYETVGGRARSVNVGRDDKSEMISKNLLNMLSRIGFEHDMEHVTGGFLMLLLKHINEMRVDPSKRDFKVVQEGVDVHKNLDFFFKEFLKCGMDVRVGIFYLISCEEGMVPPLVELFKKYIAESPVNEKGARLKGVVQFLEDAKHYLGGDYPFDEIIQSLVDFKKESISSFSIQNYMDIKKGSLDPVNFLERVHRCDAYFNRQYLEQERLSESQKTTFSPRLEGLYDYEKAIEKNMNEYIISVEDKMRYFIDAPSYKHEHWNVYYGEKERVPPQPRTVSADINELKFDVIEKKLNELYQILYLLKRNQARAFNEFPTTIREGQPFALSPLEKKQIFQIEYVIGEFKKKFCKS